MVTAGTLKCTTSSEALSYTQRPFQYPEYLLHQATGQPTAKSHRPQEVVEWNLDSTSDVDCTLKLFADGAGHI